MSKQIYTNPAFCQSSEFYPVPSASQSYYNRNLNNFNASPRKPSRDGPLRIQRSMSTRSFVSKASLAAIHQKQQQQQQQQQQHQRQPTKGATPQPQPLSLEHFQSRRVGSGRYALVPVEELPSSRNNHYAIVPGDADMRTNMVAEKRLAKSQDNLLAYVNGSRAMERQAQRDEEMHHSFRNEPPDYKYTSLPPISMFDDDDDVQSQSQSPPPSSQSTPQQQKFNEPPASYMKPAFSSDFGTKSFVIVDQTSNQRYTMIPTAEDEEFVDDNQEIIQMHNGRVHRYAIIPTDEEEEEEETCLSTSDLNQSHNYSTNEGSRRQAAAPFQTSTPQKEVTTSMPGTPMKKNPAATRMLHELLSTPRGVPIARENVISQRGERRRPSQSERNVYRTNETALPPQSLHYESVRRQCSGDAGAPPSLAIITPRLAGTHYSHHMDESSSQHNKSWSSNSYPQKVANATVTLAVVSLMLILGSSVNTGLSIYMIAYMGKSFYLQFSLVASFAGVGLGFLGFRSRHCEWLPNRSYISGYVLVTIFCLFKCCGLLLLLVLNPYPGFALHDVTTGVILGLSSFTIFFIGLGVIGSLWCYRPPPDNRVNIL